MADQLREAGVKFGATTAPLKSQKSCFGFPEEGSPLTGTPDRLTFSLGRVRNKSGLDPRGSSDYPTIDEKRF